MNTFATIRDQAQTLEQMVVEAAGGYHDEVYLKVQGDEGTVHFVTQSNGRQVMSHCEFGHLDHVDGEAEAILPVGLDADTKGFLDYLDIADDGTTMELRFLGEEGDGDHPRFATYWEADGALETRVRLPASEQDLQQVPYGLPKRFTADNEYLSARAFNDEMELDVSDDELGEYTLPTWVRVTVDSVIDSIVQPAEFMDAVGYYPITIEDGTFLVDLEGNAGDDRIRGEVPTQASGGPDVSAAFDEGFSEVFGTLTGTVSLSTAPLPDDADAAAPPLVITQADDGRVIRHVLGQFAEQ